MYIAAQCKPSSQVTSHVHELAFRPMHNCVLTMLVATVVVGDCGYKQDKSALYKYM